MLKVINTYFVTLKCWHSSTWFSWS